MLYAPVLAAVKADYADTPAGAKAIRGDAQKLLQPAHLVIDHHAQSLEGSRGRVQFAGRRKSISTRGALRAALGGKNQADQLSSSGNRLDGASLNDGLGDALVVLFVRKLLEFGGQLVFGERCQKIRSRTQQAVIHTHVQQPIILVAEATGGIIQLHARCSQVGKDDVATFKLLPGEHFPDSSEVGSMKADPGRIRHA
jgi:hypothetical protein